MSTATLTNNASTVSNLYAAFGNGNINFILDHLAPDCEWIGAGEGILPQGGTYIGRQTADFFQRLLQAEKFETFDVQAIHNINDDEVVAFGHMVATSTSTGKKAESDWVMHWKFDDDGKVIYFQDFFDTASAFLANQQ